MLTLHAVTALMSLILAPTPQLSHVPGPTLHGGPDELFARHVSRAGDVNADGFDDLVILSVTSGASGFDGIARVHSGVDLALLYSFEQAAYHPYDGIPAAGAGDVNGDGHADILVGSSTEGTVSIRSGRDGAVLFTFTGDTPGDGFGGAVAAAGDVNADGTPDVIVGTVDAFVIGSGYARVFSGADGAVLFTFHEESTHDRFGAAVSGAGDVNGDGHADLAVGAYLDGIDVLNPGFPPFIPPFWTEDVSGAVTVFSGADGAALWTVHGDTAYFESGWSVAPAGDVNGDGFDDVLAGSRSVDEELIPGHARVLSGADGSTLATLADPAHPIVFVCASGSGDLDGDGSADLLAAGLGSGAPSSATVWSGATGAALFVHEDVGASLMSVAGLGDLNGDGIDDFVVGVSQDVFGGGYAQLFLSQGAAAEALVYGSGVNPAGSLSVLSGLPALGQTVTLGLDDPTRSFATPATALLLLSSQADAAFPAGTLKPGWGLAGGGSSGELLVDVAPLQPLLVWTVGTFTGTTLEVPLAVPSIAGIVGGQVYLQAAFVGPAHEIGLTDAVRLTIGVP